VDITFFLTWPTRDESSFLRSHSFSFYHCILA